MQPGSGIASFPAMMRFSQGLEEVLKREKWTRTKLAELCDVDLSNVARWRSGKALPKREALGKLIAVLNKPDAAALLTAWILDSLPERATDFISIRPKEFSSKLEETPLPDAWPAGINATTQQKFLDFAKLAMTNGDVMEIVDVLHTAAMRMNRRKR